MRLSCLISSSTSSVFFLSARAALCLAALTRLRSASSSSSVSSVFSLDFFFTDIFFLGLLCDFFLKSSSLSLSELSELLELLSSESDSSTDSASLSDGSQSLSKRLRWSIASAFLETSDIGKGLAMSCRGSLARRRGSKIWRKAFGIPFQK